MKPELKALIEAIFSKPRGYTIPDFELSDADKRIIRREAKKRGVSVLILP